MQLTVVFEHWHLGDGNYPPFSVGDEARLSFELDARSVEPVADDLGDRILHVRDAEYEVVGRVIRQYPDAVSSTFPVVEATWLRFYCPTRTAADLAIGTRVRLQGQLALDHYQWVEFLARYPDPPDLFYPVRVVRVRQVSIPERFVQRSAQAMAHPAALAADEYGPEQVSEASAVSDEANGPAFSLLDLELLPPETGPERPTFLSAYDV